MMAIEQDSTVTAQRAKTSSWPARLQWLVIIIAVSNLALAVRRLLPIFVPLDPDLMPVITSGCEEEALFSIWKFTKGEAIYADPTAIPYATSYFNWLFYWLYGPVTKFCLAAFHLSDGWLPFITRSITLGIVLGCVSVTCAIIQEAELWPAGWVRSAKLALVSLCYFNELFREWIVTTRPDLGALFFSLMGLWCAILYFRRRKMWLLGAAVLFYYAAWAFKYNFVAVITGLCLALIATRRRRELAFVVSTTFLLYGLTFAFGSSLYRSSILSAGHSPYSFEQWWYVLKLTFDLAPHLVIVVVALLGTAFLRRNVQWNPHRLLLIFSCVVSWALALSGATKRGSDYNYFFEPSVLGFLWLLSLYQTTPTESRTARVLQMTLPIVLFASVAVTAQNGFVALADWRHRAKAAQALTGRQRQALATARPEWDVLRRSLAAMPGPVLAADRRYNLPWIQPQPPHFVVAYNYVSDRERGRSYERGGLAGLIREGYFKTIVTPVVLSTNAHMTVAATATKQGIDGQVLDRYELHHADWHFEYYMLRPDEPAANTLSARSATIRGN